jgi:hypothetical protein
VSEVKAGRAASDCASTRYTERSVRILADVLAEMRAAGATHVSDRATRGSERLDTSFTAGRKEEA